MDMHADHRNANRTNALTVWTTILTRSLERMARDYWAHAEALGRCVDDIARARTLTSYDEAHRAYRQRVLRLFEQSASEYASLWEIERRPRVDPDQGRSNKETTASADAVHDAPPPTVHGATAAKEIIDGSAAVVAEASQRLTDLERAKAAAGAVIDNVRATAAAAADAATPSKKGRARKAAPKPAKDALDASAPQEPKRKRPRRPKTNN